MSSKDIPMIRISKNLSIPFWNPPRMPGPNDHGSYRSHGPSRYVVGWTDGIVKIGITDLGSRRWGPFLSRGGAMLDLAFYESGLYPLHAELWLQRKARDMGYRPAFASKGEAEKYLGGRGSGYSDCFKIPVSEWGKLLAVAKEVPSGLV